MLVGVGAAAAAYIFARLFGAGPVDRAIAFEAGHAHAGGEGDLVSRAVQETLGLGTAVLVYGTAIGGLFALAFAFAYGRLGPIGVRATAALLAGIGFVAVQLVPMLKYPANPPATGNPDTIGQRTALFFLMIVVSVAAATAAVLTARSLTERLGVWNAVLTGAGVFVAMTAVAGLVLPGVSEVPADFPAPVLWSFRVASVGTQLVLWTGIGLLFGALTERRARRGARAVPAASAG